MISVEGFKYEINGENDFTVYLERENGVRKIHLGPDDFPYVKIGLLSRLQEEQ